MKKMLFLFALVLPFSVFSQEIRVVEHMKKIDNEAYASSHAIKTDGGKVCAVIKVGLKLEDVKFIGDSVVSQQKGEGSEYIVWVMPGCKRFTVQADPLLPFEYEFPEEAVMTTTYRLSLDIHDVRVVKPLT